MQPLEGTANDRTIELTIGDEHVSATKTRDLTNGIAALLIAVVVAMLFARLVGILMPRIGQPRVMGEVLAGILLGPTLLGAIAPELEAMLFPSDIIPYIAVVANLGLVFYMFLVGLELDLRQLRGRLTQTLAISNTGVAIPMAFGMLVAVPSTSGWPPKRPSPASPCSWASRCRSPPSPSSPGSSSSGGW